MQIQDYANGSHTFNCTPTLAIIYTGFFIYSQLASSPQFRSHSYNTNYKRTCSLIHSEFYSFSNDCGVNISLFKHKRLINYISGRDLYRMRIGHWTWGSTVAKWVALASWQEGSGFDLHIGLSMWYLHGFLVSAWIYSRCSSFLL